jgi:hypothetical protein
MFTTYCKYITRATMYKNSMQNKGWKPPWPGILLAVAETSNKTYFLNLTSSWYDVPTFVCSNYNKNNVRSQLYQVIFSPTPYHDKILPILLTASLNKSQTNTSKYDSSLLWNPHLSQMPNLWYNVGIRNGILFKMNKNNLDRTHLSIQYTYINKFYYQQTAQQNSFIDTNMGY